MLQSIEIKAKEWFDKYYGNSYFCARIITNKGHRDQEIFELPYQYGYGTQYVQEAKKLLTEFNKISGTDGESLSSYCRENSIQLDTSIKTNCKKRDVKNPQPFSY